MCLEKLNLEETKRLQSQNKQLTLYKVVRVLEPTIIISPYRYNHKYNVGINKSNRRTTKLLKNESLKNRVHKGFHVFATKRGAEECCENSDKKIVKVICNTKDLVCVGKFNLRPRSYKSLVFTKMTIPISEYTKFQNINCTTYTF